MSADVAKIIAIDGPAASGKGTLARGLAEALNFAHMDTGALYRAVAFEVLEMGGDPEREDDALKGVVRLQENLKEGKPLDNPDLRLDEVGSAASKVATLQKVREALVGVQRDFARAPGEGRDGAVLDGRDIGTVICPEAGLKLYITADDAVRAERRMKELQLKGLDVTYKAVLEDMRARDARDTAREAAPLKPAADAVIIDSSDLDATRMLKLALSHAKKAFALS